MGLGYIGLPTAAVLATHGCVVQGVDPQTSIVDSVNAGSPHFTEPELAALLDTCIRTGTLTAGKDAVPADVYLIAVQTPLGPDRVPKLDAVLSATRSIAPLLKPGNLVIIESTCPPGTTEEMVCPVFAEYGFVPGDDIHVAYCPERVLPGRILTELIENDRIVGGVSDRSTAAAVNFYEKFVRGDVHSTSARAAELVKLTENSYRDVNIAFVNEISMICNNEGLNAWEVIELANRHPRVNLLQPGPGVGGHCIAVDPWFIVHRSPETSRLIRTAREVNDSKPHWVFDQIVRTASRYKEPQIACLGLTFKADVDDLRESPAYQIVQRLISEKIGRVYACEPNLSHCSDLPLFSLGEAIAQADIVVVLVDHKPFKKLTAMALNDKVVIDTRGIIQ